MPRNITSLAALGVALTLGALGMNDGSAEHATGVRVRDYVPKGRDEAAIIRLTRTVAEGWEQRDVERILSAYAPDAVQRAWNEPARMIDIAGIRAEALGAFADPRLGRVEFDDRIHRIYVVNNSALIEINQRFHGWGRDHTTATSGCSRAATADGGSCAMTTSRSRLSTPGAERGEREMHGRVPAPRPEQGRRGVEKTPGGSWIRALAGVIA